MRLDPRCGLAAGLLLTGCIIQRRAPDHDDRCHKLQDAYILRGDQSASTYFSRCIPVEDPPVADLHCCARRRR